MRVIELPRSESDDAAFLFRLEHILIGTTRRSWPKYAHFVKIDNWFGPRWRYFAGTRDGRDLLEDRRLCVPPFAPKRIIDERTYCRHEQKLKRVRSLGLHSKTKSQNGRTRFLDLVRQSGTYCWYSGNTATHDRGSLMVYDVSDSEVQEAWYAEFTKRDGVWSVSATRGTSARELAELETSHQNRLLRLSPHPDTTKRDEDVTLWRAACDACFDNQRIAEAGVLISQYRRRYPKGQGGRLIESVNLGKRRMFASARAGLRSVEELNRTPLKSRQGWLQDWAEVCEVANDLDGAVAAYREQVSLRPDHTASFIYLGGALARQGKHEEAEATHLHATTLEGDPDEAFLNVALVRRSLGRFHEAKEACEKALTLCPDYPAVDTVLADLRDAICLQEAAADSSVLKTLSHPGLPKLLKRNDGDDASFIFRLEHLLGGTSRYVRPRIVHIARVDNWFGPRWRCFAGHRNGKDIVEEERLCVPPFAPKRIVTETAFRRQDDELQPTETRPLHTRFVSRAAPPKHLDTVSTSGLFCWYSGNTANQDRASLMVYEVIEGETQRAWYVGFQQRDGVWLVEKTVGTSVDEVARLETNEGNRLLPLYEHSPTRAWRRKLWLAALEASYGGDRTAAQAQVLTKAYILDSPDDRYGQLLYARSLAGARHFDEAEKIFRECEAALGSPKDRRTWLRERRDAADLRGDFFVREAACRELASERPNDGREWMQLGRCLADQGKHDEAEAILRHACELESDSTEVSYLHLGLVMRDLGRLEEAAAAFQSGLRAFPGHRPCQVALTDVKAALQLEPESSDSCS